MNDIPTTIRTSTLNAESRGGPVRVCDHVTLPSAHPDVDGAGEYTMPLSIRCDECEETYAVRINVN